MRKLKINKIITFIFFIAFSLLSSTITLNALDNTERTSYLQPDYFSDLENTEDLIGLFDYCFEGMLFKLEGVSQYNGNGTDIPYTFYRVKVTKKVKGIVDNQVIIKFYGGYNEEGELILPENATMPEIGEIYTFYCNRTKLNYKDDQRTIDGSYIISSPECIVKGHYQEKNEVPAENETINIDKPMIPKTFFYRDELEFSILSFSDPFLEASIISLNTTYKFKLYGDNPRYFKIKRDTLDYLAFYSTGDFDVKVSVYDEYLTLVGTNDDVNTSRGYLYTSGYNFFFNFYADKKSTYFFKVSTYNPNASDSTTIKCVVDNYYESDYSKLINSKHAVKNESIYYDNQTSYSYYISMSAAEWNKLNTIQLRHYSTNTRKDVTIYTYNDPDTTTLAYTNKHWLFGWRVYYNDYYFSTMKASERFKTIMHEFGHLLGFDEFNGPGYGESNNNVMVQGMRGLYNLGPADIAVYRKRWG